MPVIKLKYEKSVIRGCDKRENKPFERITIVVWNPGLRRYIVHSVLVKLVQEPLQKKGGE
jgi:hypothetical protein